MEILRNTIPLLLAVVAYLAWKKYQDKDYWWLAAIFAADFILTVLTFFIKTFFELPPELNILRSGISIVIWVVLILLVIKIALKNLRK